MEERRDQTDQTPQLETEMLIPSLRCCYPMPISPRGIVPNMLLMSARKISNPVEALIQMIIQDPARCTYLHLRIHI
jgi:hypothetical protein